MLYSRDEGASFLNCKSSMADIGREWQELQQGKRVKKARTVTTRVAGVGEVQVLAALCGHGRV